MRIGRRGESSSPHRIRRSRLAVERVGALLGKGKLRSSGVGYPGLGEDLDPIRTIPSGWLHVYEFRLMWRASRDLG